MSFRDVLYKYTDIERGVNFILINHNDKIISYESKDSLIDRLELEGLTYSYGIIEFNNGRIQYKDCSSITIEDILEYEKLSYTSEIYEESIITFNNVHDSICYIVENYYMQNINSGTDNFFKKFFNAIYKKLITSLLHNSYNII